MTQRVVKKMEIRRPEPDTEEPDLLVLVARQILIDGEIVRCSAGLFVTDVRGWAGPEGPEVSLSHRERVLAFAILIEELAKACRRYCGAADCYIGREEDGQEEYFRCRKSTAPKQPI